MFNFIRVFCNHVLFSDDAQDVWSDVIRSRRSFDSTLPVNYDEWTWVPKWVVWTFIDESYARKRLAEAPERIDDQRASLEENGWTEPILLTWDENGKAKVKDGNHRLIAAMESTFDYVPIELQQVPGIRSGATNVGKVLAEILRDYGEQTRFQLETRDYLL